ncbi:UvrABC system protein A, partial [Striga asiatica]
TTRKMAGTVPEHNGDGITHDGEGVSEKTLHTPERVSDRLKRLKLGARISSQPDNDDFVDDVPLADSKTKRPVTRRTTRLSLVQQGDTSAKHDNTQEDPTLDRMIDSPERVGDYLKHSNVGARIMGQPDSDNVLDDQDDTTTEHALAQDDPMSKGSLNEPERVGDLPKHSKAGERITRQNASDDDLDDVPLSELAKKRYGARHSTSLPLLHQGDTSMNHNNKQDVKGKSEMADTDIVVEHDTRLYCPCDQSHEHFPVFRSWSNEALKARERAEIVSGAFGRGFVDVDFRSIADSRRLDKSGLKYDGASDVAGVTEGHCIVQEFASKTRLLATTGVEILQLVEKAPHVLLGDVNFVKIHEAAQKLLGVYIEPAAGMQTEVDVQKVTVGLSDKSTDKAAIVEDSGLEPDKYVTIGINV